MTSPLLLLLLRRLGHIAVAFYWMSGVITSSPSVHLAVHRAARYGRAEAGLHFRGASGGANFAFLVNEGMENIGAPRLHTIMERVLDEISFEAPDVKEKNLTSRCR